MEAPKKLRWVEALRIWNAHHKSVNPTHVWMVPRKNTPEHAQVKEIMVTRQPPKSKKASPEMKAKHSANIAAHNERVMIEKGATKKAAMVNKIRQHFGKQGRAVEGLQTMSTDELADIIERYDIE